MHEYALKCVWEKTTPLSGKNNTYPDGVNLAAPYQPSPGVGVTGDCLHDPW